MLIVFNSNSFYRSLSLSHVHLLTHSFRSLSKPDGVKLELSTASDAKANFNEKLQFSHKVNQIYFSAD